MENKQTSQPKDTGKLTDFHYGTYKDRASEIMASEEANEMKTTNSMKQE
ncbi:hypothetical protein [Bacillus sp. M6-12]|nr:hypothetical protein [Bacillus sp. M6-12]